MATRILAVDDNPVNLKLVVVILKQAGYDVYAATNGADALTLADETHPDLVISDVEMPEMNGYELTRRLRQRSSTAQVPIMILTSHDTVQEKIRGFEAGADDYVTKPFEPNELQARVRVLLRRVATPQLVATQVKGKVIAVFSLRGGVGVSTLAANLATGLAQLWGSSTGLIDLVLTSGQSALMLNLPLRKTWADMSRTPAVDIDSEVIDKVLLPHSSGAFVLAAPNRPEQGELLTGDKVARVIKQLKERFQYVVLDLPHDFSETTLAGLDNAEEIVLVMSPEMASLHAAACALDVFDSLKYPRKSIRLVLNWTFERRGLARKEIEDALQHLVDVVIPFVPDTFVMAINKGAPPVLEIPPTPISSLLEDFAFLLSQSEQQQGIPATPTAAWQRVTSRNQQRQSKRT